MSDNTTDVEANALLEGGPHHLWETRRHIPDSVSYLKLCYGAGYEHYIRSDRKLTVDGRGLTVYAWVSNTKVAE